jgi:hypothetical protein
MLKEAQPTGSIDGFVGLLVGRSKRIASIDEINSATRLAWANKRK